MGSTTHVLTKEEGEGFHYRASMFVHKCSSKHLYTRSLLVLVLYKVYYLTDFCTVLVLVCVNIIHGSGRNGPGNTYHMT